MKYSPREQANQNLADPTQQRKWLAVHDFPDSLVIVFIEVYQETHIV
jgi:hypothetical protein